MAKQAFKRNTRIARPFLVAYRKDNSRWYLYGAKTLEEAENKIASLLRRKNTKMCILSKVMYDAALTAEDSKEQAENG